MISPGQKLRQALTQECPLQIVGTINAFCALLAKSVGFKVFYLSGAGVANAAFGVPDLALTSLTEVTEELRRITSCCEEPVIVDADTGWGSALNIQRSIAALEHAGAAGLHLEDQSSAKRCGHRDGKHIVSIEEMCDRLKAALDARKDPNFFMIARTDALATEPLTKVLDRVQQYAATGVDAIFLEAVTDPQQYAVFAKELSVPLLANMTEFGKTPLQTKEQLQQLGVKMILYPLGAFRMMNQAALQFYKILKEQGTQEVLLPHMQTRQDLYHLLNYWHFEEIQNRYLNTSR